MISIIAMPQHREPTPKWSGSVVAAESVILIAFLSSCGDVGGPGPYGTNITPQSFAASRQVLSGSSQDFSGNGKSDILW
jgi:hypothetical protein